MKIRIYDPHYGKADFEVIKLHYNNIVLCLKNNNKIINEKEVLFCLLFGHRIPLL